MGKSQAGPTAVGRGSDGKHDALYLRVSGRGQDTASQEPDLKRWAESQDGPVVWYRDKFTGKTMDHPGWNKLAKDIEAGKVRKLACWRLDRLGRTAKGLTALFEDLVTRKINLVSLKDGLTSRPPPAASWRTCLPLWPPMRPRFAPSASAPARTSPGPPASTWEGPPESESQSR